MGDLVSGGWLPIGLTVLLLLATWLANCVLLGGALQTASGGQVVPVAYFFVGSQAIAALLYVTLNLPPAAVGLIFGTAQVQSRIRVFCLYSTYLDTLFCNLTFLQTFFSSLDAYLRLRNPTFYLNSARRRPALWLKVGSPWLVAALQAIGQLALSDRDQVSLHFATQDGDHAGDSWGDTQSLQTTCILPDPNFLIIRTAVAYALPLIVCIILVGMQLRCLRLLRNYSHQSLQALLQVRSNVQSLSSTNRPMSIATPFLNKPSHRSPFVPTISNPDGFQAPVPVNLRKLNSHSLRSPVSHLLTSSFHLDHQGTFETLIPDGALSTHQLQCAENIPQLFTPSTHLSHVLLPTSTMPFFEIRPIDTSVLKTDMLYATTESSIINCPAHGQVTVTVSEKPGQKSNFDLQSMTSIPLTSAVADRLSEDLSRGGDPKDPLQMSQVSDTVLSQRNNCTELFPLETKPFDSVVPSRENKSIVKSSSTYSMPPMCTRPSVTRKGASLSPAGQKRRRSSSLVNTASKNDDYLGAATPLWLRAYKGEQLAVAINLVSCIIAVGTWSPFILSTLAHGLCQPIKLPIIGYPSRMRPVYTMHPAVVNLPQNTNPPSRCMIQVTPDRIADFRWWAYASAGLLLPCLLFFLDLGLREGCWRALRYSDRTDDKLDTKQGRGKKGRSQTAIKSLRATDSSRTYRCADSKSLRNFPRTDQKTTSDQKLVEVIRLDELWNKRMAETADNTTDVQDVPGSTSNT